MRLISAADVEAVLDPAAAAAAVADALAQETAGRTRLPARLTIELDRGWFRVMPGALGDVYGLKVMNLKQGHGIYYQLLLFDAASGEPLALMDGSVLTQVRTGAASAVCVQAALPQGVPVAGLFGTGFEARGQVRALAGQVGRLRVYSPNREHRERFAAEMSALLPVEPVGDPREAAAGLPLVVLATRAAEPVLQADWLAAGTVVVSIGSTRLDLREVDVATVHRAGRVVVDQVEQALGEAGDLRAAGVTAADLALLHEVLAGPVDLRGDIRLFKPQGTALQDLAVGLRVYEACLASGRGLRVDDLPTRKDR